MKYLALLIFLAFFITNLSAQQDHRIAPLALDSKNIDVLEMAPLDNKDLRRAEMELRRKGRPNHFAHTFNIDQSTQSIGKWTTLSDGSIIWRLRIHSKSAKSLNLGFSKYKMPAGGTMVIYTPDYENIIGPFTPADNEEHEQLWTPVIDGDDIIVEVWLKENNRNNFELELKSVNHDFIGINSASFMSGSCNLDVICTEADGWGIVDGYRDIIQSVAFMHLNGSANCTGFLVNNTAQDCTPLFMTADHCGMSAGNAPSLVTYWNFENSTCRQPNSAESGGNGDGPLNDFNSGSTMRATYTPTDFTIVELDDPVNPSAKAYRAGWNADEMLATSAIAVHHPSNDEKRISFEEAPVYRGEWGSGDANIPTGNHVVVPDWDIGTTEPGSSGSPLFDQDKRVIGQLHGGGAACGNDEYDIYGWFHSSWEGGGAPNNRLKDWIDPINSGIMIIDGKDCGFSVEADNVLAEICAPSDAVYQLTVSENFENNVNLTVEGLPAGLTATFSNNAPAPGEIVTLTISNTASQAFGNYPFTVNGTDGVESSNTNLFLELYDAIPAMAGLINPADMSMDITTSPTFEWSMTSASTYEIEVATDVNFSNIVVSNPMLTSEIFTSNNFLEPLTTYFWRIRGNNLCGTGSWSNTQSFTTANIACNISAAADLPIGISDGPANTITSTMDVAAGGIISDLNVINLEGTHSWIADLTFTLESPAGTSVVLIAEACDDEDNFDINFDDQSSGMIPCPYADGGTYPPAGSLAAFNGENPQGTWTLTVDDGANQDGGNLNNWGLEICSVPDNSLDITPSQTDFTICAGASATFDVYLGGGFEPPIQIAQFGGGSGVDLTFNPANPTPGSTVSVTMDVDAGVVAGDYPVEFTVDDANNSLPASVNLEVLTLAASPSLNMPADDATNVVISPTMQWTNPGGYDDLTVTISLDPNFSNNIIVNQNLPVAATTYNYPGNLIGETTYYWKVEGSNDCGTSVSTTFTFVTESVLGIDLLGDQYFELLPNPTQGNLTINLAYPMGDIIFGEVLHINGRKIKDFNIPFGAQTHSLDLSNFPAGIYVVKLRHADFIATNKVVLN